MIPPVDCYNSWLFGLAARGRGWITGVIGMLCLGLSSQAHVLPLMLDDGQVLLDGGPLISCGGFASVKLSSDGGAMLSFAAEAEFAERTFNVGRLPSLARATVICRKWSACWIEPVFVTSVAGIPPESQFVLFATSTGRYGVMVPLLDRAFRCSLEGGENGVLRLRAKSGDTHSTVRRVTGLYIAAGDDPYELVERAAAAVRGHLRPEARGAAATLPDFARYLGWCTWNAFYEKISQKKLETALRHFAQAGVPPGFVLVDCGWQQTNAEKELIGYNADAVKFPGGVRAITRALHDDFGVKRVLLWHTFNGFWRGASASALPATGVHPVKPAIAARFPATPIAVAAGEGATVTKTFYPPFFYSGTVSEPDPARLYAAYHAELRAQGVDGVKIDAMSWAEVMGEGRGGRVKAVGDLVRAAHRAADAFHGNLLWCSSLSNDVILQAPRSAVMRSSNDYFPRIPSSHGRHIMNNAYNSLWLGEFVMPDWDMFQSGHPAGAFHAAARAISGGPVYCSDEPGLENAALLRRLTLSDRTIPLCIRPARPCADNLFDDPVAATQPLKIFNFNHLGAVVGAFNCATGTSDRKSVRGIVHPNDAHGIKGHNFVIYRHVARTLAHGDRTLAVPFELAPQNFEIFTIAAVVGGFAPIGLADKYNSGGTISGFEQCGPGTFKVELRDGGEFVGYAATAPRRIVANTTPLHPTYDAATGKITAQVPAGAPVSLIVTL